MTDRNRLAARAIALFLFLTGGSALVYQVLWSRYLSLLLGSSAVAVVVVLAAFMGGLATGSWAFGRVADRSVRRLTLYAWLEMGVGLYCLLFPGLLSALEGPYLKVVGPLYGARPVAFATARLLFAALLLVPPTVLMGGTLPAASRFLLGLEPGVRRAVGRLYWVNSMGAVLGALLAGFWMIPTLGLDLSMDAAAAVNVMVGVAAIWLRTRIGEDPAAVPGVDEAEVPLPPRAARAALAAVTVSGFSALVLEVAWTRLLALVLGGSTYAFTLMVATFILGIALGSRAVARAKLSGRDPVLLLAALLGACGVLLAASIPGYPLLPFLFQRLRAYVSTAPAAYPVFQATQLLVCGLVMLLPTVVLGATLPLASRIAARDPAASGGRIGLTWALNTAGTLAGALLGGLVLLPRLGLQATLSLVAALYGAAGLVALAGSSSWRSRGAAAAAAAAVAGLVGAPLLPRWDLALLTSGAFRTRGTFVSFEEFARIQRDARILFHRDGPTCSVTVARSSAGYTMLRVNGKVDASTGKDMATQLLLGHLPAFLAPAGAREALVIGLGSGGTVGALAAHPGLRVTAVEIEPAVVEAARRHFADVNDGALDRPDVRVVVEDAKTIFQVLGRRYDIVVSEPSNPWLAGIGGLFSEDYFRRARAHLAPGGLMAQWMHAYEMDDATAREVLATFRAVFRHVTVWHPHGTDYVLLGGDGPAEVDPALLATRFAAPAVRRSLERVGIGSVHALLARQAISAAGVEILLGGVPARINTDQFPTLEFSAPRGFFTGGSTRIFDAADERRRLLGRSLLFHRYAELRPPDHDALLSLARTFGEDLPRLRELALREALRLRPGSAEAARELARDLAPRGTEAWQAGEPLLRAGADAARRREMARLRLPGALADCRDRNTSLFESGACAEAVRLSEDLAREPGARGPEDDAARARAYLWSGRAREAADLAERLLARGGEGAGPGQRAELLELRGAARLRLGDGAGARRDADEALRLKPEAAGARRVRAFAGGEAPGAAAP